MHYATHAISPLLKLAGTRATRVHCFGSGVMRPGTAQALRQPLPGRNRDLPTRGREPGGRGDAHALPHAPSNMPKSSASTARRPRFNWPHRKRAARGLPHGPAAGKPRPADHHREGRPAELPRPPARNPFAISTATRSSPTPRTLTNPFCRAAATTARTPTWSTSSFAASSRIAARPSTPSPPPTGPPPASAPHQSAMQGGAAVEIPSFA